MRKGRVEHRFMSLPPDYIAGFIDGEGCFVITICKSSWSKIGIQSQLNFQIELRDDDEDILRKIKETLGCGRIYHLQYERYGWNPHSRLMISRMADINDKLIPFLRKTPLRAKKRHSFKLFCEAVEVFNHKKHLTLEGIEQLREIRSRMNVYSKKRSMRPPGCGKTARPVGGES